MLLLCHRCFTNSLDLMEAIRKRFFTPMPQHLLNSTNELILQWVEMVQRPIQQKCISILCEWICDYHELDFGKVDPLQPDVLPPIWKALQSFSQEIQQCKLETNDEWYDHLHILLVSAMENYNPHNIREKRAHTVDMVMDRHQVKRQERRGARNAIFGPSRVEEVKAKEHQFEYPLPSDMREDLSKEKKKLLLLDYSPQTVAKQITLQDFVYFRRIDSREFLDKVWKFKKEDLRKGDIKGGHPCLRTMIDRFNAFHRYIIVQVLSPETLNVRSLALQHLIDIAEQLLVLRNYFSLMAVNAALDSSSVSRLKLAWMRVSAKHKAKLETWQFL